MTAFFREGGEYSKNSDKVEGGTPKSPWNRKWNRVSRVVIVLPSKVVPILMRRLTQAKTYDEGYFYTKKVRLGLASSKSKHIIFQRIISF